MKTLAPVLGGGAVFFALLAAVYGFLTHWEPVGTTTILLTGGLVAMIGGYLATAARRMGEQPSDDPDAEIEQGAGDQGVYSPWSWWPLVLAAAAATCFLGLAVGWWVFYLGAALGVVGLAGWVFEFSRGQHAH